MIPLFPKFKPLTLKDKTEIEKITFQYPPYSDFNFVSLWSWDIDNETTISQLNKNFVIRFPDYVTRELFYSFIGTHKIHKTITTLLDQAKKENLMNKLQLIPKSVINHLTPSQKNHWHIKQSRDDHDYILSVSTIKDFSGRPFKKKRNMVKNYLNKYGQHTQVKSLNLDQKITQKQIVDLFIKWEKSRSKDRKETQEELKAIQKLLTGTPKLKLETTGVYYQNQLIAFAIEEIVQNHHAISHYAKADITYPGIFEYLKQQATLHLHHKKVKYINYEQDLGIEGMRQSKLSYRPIKFLKKYTICPKE